VGSKKLQREMRETFESMTDYETNVIAMNVGLFVLGGEIDGDAFDSLEPKKRDCAYYYAGIAAGKIGR
jgi:hypothetical protein